MPLLHFFTLLKFVARIAQITETWDNILLYEYCMVVGAIVGSVLCYVNFNFDLNKFIIILIGILSGVFFGIIYISFSRSVKCNTSFRKEI